MSPSTSDAHNVFVYGTLKRGLYNHRLLERGNARFMGEVRTKRAQHVMLLADAGYPYLVKSTTDDARAMNANDAMQVRSKSAARDGESDTPRARRFDFFDFRAVARALTATERERTTTDATRTR